MKDEVYLVKLGRKIERLRMEKGFTMTEFARSMETNHTQVWRIETGKVNSTINMLRKVAKILEMDVSELVSLP